MELALVLLPRGITPERFSRLAREAFIRAAADRSRLRNGRVNQSKVAALTGLSRREIKRLLDADRSRSRLVVARSACTPSERVVYGWRTDRRYLTRAGRPKTLSVGARRSAFERLVKEYGGDISPRALLEELITKKAIHKTGRRLELRVSKLPSGRGNLGTFSRIVPTLIDGLRIASPSSRSSIDSLLYRLRLHASSETELSLIRERCSSAIQALLSGLESSLMRQLTVPTRKRSHEHALNVTVLLADSRAARLS